MEIALRKLLRVIRMFKLYIKPRAHRVCHDRYRTKRQLRPTLCGTLQSVAFFATVRHDKRLLDFETQRDLSR